MFAVTDITIHINDCHPVGLIINEPASFTQIHVDLLHVNATGMTIGARISRLALIMQAHDLVFDG